MISESCLPVLLLLLFGWSLCSISNDTNEGSVQFAQPADRDALCSGTMGEEVID